MPMTGRSGVIKIGRRALIVLAMCIVLSGCASMYAPDSDSITIKTIPDGANVYAGAKLLGKTPLTYTFRRDTFERRTLQIRKEGYKEHELLLEKTLEKTALYNFAFITTTSGATSWGIDALNGNMVRYYPDSYLIELEKKGSPINTTDSTHTLRLRFTVMNQARLMTDIAAGDGEYLKAFYELGPVHSSRGTYHSFVGNVLGKRDALLSTYEPVAFYNELDSVLPRMCRFEELGPRLSSCDGAIEGWMHVTRIDPQ